MISLIVAMSDNHVIGAHNDLPWYLPADLRHFKELTTGHIVVMGHRTFDSILARLGRPLPHRTNVVLTRDTTYHHEGVEVIHDIGAISSLGDDVFVIGGAEIYRQTIEMADRLYVTEVHAEINGDTYFPVIGPKWREIAREPHQKDDRNPYDYDFVVYEQT